MNPIKYKNIIDIVEPPTFSLFKKIERIDRKNLKFLSLYLKDCQSEDPYLHSPSYFAMTGRKGLWLYRGKESNILCCRHPNIDDKILVFPPLKNKISLEDIRNFINSFKCPLQNLEFVRFNKEQSIDLRVTLNKLYPQINFSICSEDVLDFRYPSHTLSSKLLINPTGKETAKYRHKLNQIDKSKIKEIPITEKIQKKLVLAILQNWYQQSPDKSLSDIESALYISDLIDSDLNLNGFYLTKAGEPCGLALWENPVHNSNTANAYINIAAKNELGLNDYLYFVMGKILAKQNIPYVCIGGSETEGLDKFKRKFAPVESIELQSIKILEKSAQENDVTHAQVA